MKNRIFVISLALVSVLFGNHHSSAEQQRDRGEYFLVTYQCSPQLVLLFFEGSNFTTGFIEGTADTVIAGPDNKMYREVAKISGLKEFTVRGNQVIIYVDPSTPVDKAIKDVVTTAQKYLKAREMIQGRTVKNVKCRSVSTR